MRRRLAAALALALGWSLLAASPARADDPPYYDPYNGVNVGPPAYCDENPYLDPEVGLCAGIDHQATIVIVGGRYIWGARTVARWIDERSTGLTFIFGSNCNDYIGQPVYCLTFVKRNLTEPDLRLADWNGWEGGGTQQMRGTVRLNAGLYRKSLLINRRHAAGHELLHALGFAHSTEQTPCLMGNYRWGTLPSAREMRALNAYYN